MRSEEEVEEFFDQSSDAAPQKVETVTHQDLQGTYSDSYGNLVRVYCTDAFTMRLIATLSRPPRQDIHLKLRPLAKGGWQCGDAVLDKVHESGAELHWAFPRGEVSTWRRQEDHGARMYQAQQQSMMMPWVMPGSSSAAPLPLQANALHHMQAILVPLTFMVAHPPVQRHRTRMGIRRPFAPP